LAQIQGERVGHSSFVPDASSKVQIVAELVGEIEQLLSLSTNVCSCACRTALANPFATCHMWPMTIQKWRTELISKTYFKTQELST
jgi:hypothetical protein